MSAPNHDPTIRERLADVESRLRRVEILVAGVLVATVSPKLGAPSVPQAVYWVVTNVGSPI